MGDSRNKGADMCPTGLLIRKAENLQIKNSNKTNRRIGTLEPMMEEGQVGVCKSGSPVVNGGFEAPDMGVQKNGRPVCKRCDSEIHEYAEHGEVPEGQTRAADVIKQICDCPDRMPFMTERVRRPSLVMRQYQIGKENERKRNEGAKLREKAKNKRTSNLILRLLTKCLRSNSITMDMTEFHLDTKEISITNPKACNNDPLVGIGLKVAVLRDERGMLRHFVEEIKPDSPAEHMGLIVEDEILLLNGHLLVDVFPEIMEEMFARINVDEQFSLLTRRIAGRKSAIDMLNPDIVGYEYWATKAVITLDAQQIAVLVRRATVKKTFTNGDLVVATDATVLPRYIKIDDGYLHHVDNKLGVNESARDDDANFRFDVLVYGALVMSKEGSWHNNKRIMIFRHSQETSLYFYVNESGDVELKKAPSALSSPPISTEFNQTPVISGFNLHSTCFLEHPCSTVGDVYYLESYTKRNTYLKYNNKHRRMKVEYAANTNDLSYMDNVTFKILREDHVLEN